MEIFGINYVDKNGADCQNCIYKYMMLHFSIAACGLCEEIEKHNCKKEGA